MKRIFHPVTAIVGLVATLMCTSGAAAAGYVAEQDFGSPGLDNVYERVITISPRARWVNVNRDETIKFIDASSGKSFVWQFSTRASRFDLSKVAPSGVLSGRNVDVYIGISSREINQENSNTRTR